jgi:hypothetical protein
MPRRLLNRPAHDSTATGPDFGPVIRLTDELVGLPGRWRRYIRSANTERAM